MLVVYYLIRSVYFCFFFQAEDGIRDLTVTGVQTCALPISMAWARWAVCQASYWAVPNSSFSEGCQPMAVGKKRTSAPRRAVRRAPSGYHWSQQTSVPMGPCVVCVDLKPRSPGVK